MKLEVGMRVMSSVHSRVKEYRFDYIESHLFGCIPRADTLCKELNVKSYSFGRGCVKDEKFWQVKQKCQSPYQYNP